MNDLTANPRHTIFVVAMLVFGLIVTNSYLGITLFSEYQDLNRFTVVFSDSTTIRKKLDYLMTQNELLQDWLVEQQSEFNKNSFPNLVLSYAKKYGIQNISKLSSAKTDGSNPFVETYQISLSATYSQVMRFVNKLEISSIPIRITQLEMELKPDGQIACDLKLGILKNGYKELVEHN